MPETNTPPTKMSEAGRQRRRGTSIVPSMSHLFSSPDDKHKDQKTKKNSSGVQYSNRISLDSDDSGVASGENTQDNMTETILTLPPITKQHSLTHPATPSGSVSVYLKRQPHVLSLDSPKEPLSVEHWLRSLEETDGSEGVQSAMENPLTSKKQSFLPKIKTKKIELVSDDDSLLDGRGQETPLHIPPRRVHFHDPIQTYRRICKLQRVTPVEKFIKQIDQPKIELRNHLLGPADIRGIAIAMASEKKTRILDISGNTIGPLGTSYLAQALEKISQLDVLIMAATFPDVKGCQRLSESLSKNDCLRVLHLGENQLGEQHAVHLASFMKVTKNLRELNLNHNQLDEAGGKVIGAALAQNKSIQTLDLTWNHLRRNGAVAICKSLEFNSTLEKLNVSWNGFSVEGCKCLAKILPKNDTLRHLNISSNRINSRALIFFLKGLVKNEGITSLQIGKNPLTTDAAITIIETLTVCDYCSIDDLDLSDVPVDEEFFEAVEKLREKRIVSIRHGPFYRQEEVKKGEQSTTMGLERFDPVLVLYEYMKLDSMRLIDMFHYFDSDQNGYISLTELREGLANANIPLTEDGLETLIKKIDTDEDGKIDLQELMTGHRRFSRSVAERNRIAKLHRKKEDASLRTLRKIIKKLLVERNDKLKETKSDTEGKTSSLKPTQKISVSDSGKTRRSSRRSRVSVYQAPALPPSIAEETEADLQR